MILQRRQSVYLPPNVQNNGVAAGVAPWLWGASGNGIDEFPWVVAQSLRDHEVWRIRVRAQMSSQSAASVSIESAALVLVPVVSSAYFVGQPALIRPAFAQGATALADGMPVSGEAVLETDRYFSLFPRASALGVLVATELNNTTAGAVVVSLNAISIEIDYELSDSQGDYV